MEIQTSKNKHLFSLVAISWALFQLALPGIIILDSIRVRAIHLAFALALAFISLPFRKKRDITDDHKGPSPFINLSTYTIVTIASFSALYIMLDWEGIAMRAGSPILRDIIIGLLVILFLLESARRSIGPALSAIVILLSLYAFLGPYLPGVLAFRGVTLRKYVTQLSLSSEGIYGIPLGVSASIVYLFVLLGSLLEKAGAGKFFIDCALSLLGKYKGGPAKAAVVSSGLMGMVSGSSIANIVTTGTFTIPLMKKTGYPAKKAAAIEVASSTDGQLMPPIMGAAAFIIAEYVNVPYIEVVKAAAIPAFASYCALFYITHLEASKLGLKGLSTPDIPSFVKTIKQGFHFLIPIGMLLFELLVLRHSPEMAAFRTILVLLIIMVVQTVVTARQDNEPITKGLLNGICLIKDGMIQGSKNMISVALATAAAGIVVGIVNMGIGGMITQVVESLSMGNIFLLLLIAAIASLLLGMGLPTTATYIVMASLTAPIIVHVGASYGLIVPLVAAHLFCFYFGILADDTPPVGLASYAAAAIADSRPIPTGIQGFLYDLRTAVIPFMFIFNTDIILHNITSIPVTILIFAMTSIAACLFTSVVQGWFVKKNTWCDTALLVAATATLFNPGFVCSVLGINLDVRFFLYGVGLVLLFGTYILQKGRKSKTLNS